MEIVIGFPHKVLKNIDIKDGLTMIGSLPDLRTMSLLEYSNINFNLGQRLGIISSKGNMDIS